MLLLTKCDYKDFAGDVFLTKKRISNLINGIEAIHSDSYFKQVYVLKRGGQEYIKYRDRA